MHALVLPLLREFIATFVLCFFVLLVFAVLISFDKDQQLIVLVQFLQAIVYAVIFFLVITILRAQANPLFSLSLAIRGQLHWAVLIAYWVVQFLAAIAAGSFIVFLFGKMLPMDLPWQNGQDWLKIIILELFLTAILCAIFLSNAANKDFYLFLYLLISVFLVLPLYGSYLNPAVSLAQFAFSQQLTQWWLYLLGGIGGALLCGLIYLVVDKAKKNEDKEEEEVKELTDSVELY